MKTPRSSTTWDWLSAFPWYPLLLAVYAPVALLENNLGQVEMKAGIRPILVTLLIASLILLVAKWILKDWLRAGLAAALVIVLLVSYGHIYNLIKNESIAGFIVGRHRFLIIVWLALAVGGMWWIARKPGRIPASFNATMNLVCLVLLLIPSFQILSFAVSSTGFEEQTVKAAEATATESQLSLPEGETPPDVYYIILDGYGRSDVLLKELNYDNSAFLDGLRKLGFVVVECAQSNYSKTALSLSSSLNMDHINALGDDFTPDKTDRQELGNLIKGSKVKALFKKLGYTTVAFTTGYSFTEVTNSDIYYSPPAKGFNVLENLYLQTTLAAVLDDAGLLKKMQWTPEDGKRQLIQYDLAQLKEIPGSVPGPKFVFAHLVIPHQPFVFGPNGEALVIPERTYKGRTYYPPKDYAQGYRNQSMFISSQILPVIQTILKESARPPVIIIQGDHGPSHFVGTQRMAIINAYYFPGHESAVYPEITPVNSFRMLFDNYFNGKFDRVQDISYESANPRVFDFKEVPNTCKP
jgi:hypothetical protein